MMNPGASVFPVACRGVSERLEQFITTLRIEDSLQFAAGSFNKQIIALYFNDTPENVVER